MKRYIAGVSFLWLMLLAVLPVQAQRPTRVRQFPKMYEEKPASIVIMPPINRTNFVEAKEYFYTTLYVPLCEKGYYVFSPYLTMELFRSESAYDSELYFNGNLAPFREVTGADAAMFTIVKQWDRDNLNGKLRVRAEFILRSTKTNVPCRMQSSCFATRCGKPGFRRCYTATARDVSPSPRYPLITTKPW